MNGHPTRSHQQILSITSLAWTPSGFTRVSLTIKGQTSTPGWSEFSLVPSASHPSTGTDLHFDAWGLPPTGIVNQVVTDIEFRHSLHAGKYDVTVHGKTSSATTHVDHEIIDPPV